MSVARSVAVVGRRRRVWPDLWPSSAAADECGQIRTPERVHDSFLGNENRTRIDARFWPRSPGPRSLLATLAGAALASGHARRGRARFWPRSPGPRSLLATLAGGALASGHARRGRARFWPRSPGARSLLATLAGGALASGYARRGHARRGDAADDRRARPRSAAVLRPSTKMAALASAGGVRPGMRVLFARHGRNHRADGVRAGDVCRGHDVPASARASTSMRSSMVAVTGLSRETMPWAARICSGRAGSPSATRTARPSRTTGWPAALSVANVRAPVRRLRATPGRVPCTTCSASRPASAYRQLLCCPPWVKMGQGADQA